MTTPIPWWAPWRRVARYVEGWRYRRTPEHKAWRALYDSGAICSFCDTAKGGKCPVPADIQPDIPCLNPSPIPCIPL